MNRRSFLEKQPYCSRLWHSENLEACAPAAPVTQLLLHSATFIPAGPVLCFHLNAILVTRPTSAGTATVRRWPIEHSSARFSASVTTPRSGFTAGCESGAEHDRAETLSTVEQIDFRLMTAQAAS